MIKLYQDGEPILVNMDRIQTIFPRHLKRGSVIYFIGEDGGLLVDDSLEDLHKRINVLS
jgi:hypothetical protein